jgi:transcriptional regulator with XRE-family HTH domain
MTSPMDGRVWRERGALSPRTARLLRQARIERGLGLREAARLLQLDPGYLSRLERGLRRPSVEVADRLGSVMGLVPDAADALLAEAVVRTLRRSAHRVEVKM